LGFTSSLSGSWPLSRISAGKVAFGGAKGEEERQMGVQEKSIQYSDRVKIKRWYWPLLILGSVMVVGGIISVFIL
jgi:hypothetical protein